MQSVSDLARRRGALAACCLVLAAGCTSSYSSGGSGPSAPSVPVIESFTVAAGTVHVGESTELTAVFDGDSVATRLRRPL